MPHDWQLLERYPPCPAGRGLGGHRAERYICFIKVGALVVMATTANPASRVAALRSAKARRTTWTELPSPRLVPEAAYAAPEIVAAYKHDGRVAGYVAKWLAEALSRRRVVGAWYRASLAQIQALEAPSQQYAADMLGRYEARKTTFRLG